MTSIFFEKNEKLNPTFGYALTKCMLRFLSICDEELLRMSVMKICLKI